MSNKLLRNKSNTWFTQKLFVCWPNLDVISQSYSQMQCLWKLHPRRYSKWTTSSSSEVRHHLNRILKWMNFRGSLKLHFFFPIKKNVFRIHLFWNSGCGDPWIRKHSIRLRKKPNFMFSFQINLFYGMGTFIYVRSRKRWWGHIDAICDM